jgi:putative protein-disulfide isomerase
MAAMETPRLLAFIDTMCSWCYGFAPQMAVIRNHYGARLDHLTFSGGLRPFTKEPMDAKKRSFLTDTYDKIGSITGQPFVHTRILDPDFIYDTEPASRAVVTMRHLVPGEDHAYQVAIQSAFYAQGQDITKPEILASFAPAFGPTRDEFLEAFASEAMREATLNDFRVAQKFGIDGFPTLILHRVSPEGENQLLLVCKGFALASDVIERIDAGLEGSETVLN